MAATIKIKNSSTASAVPTSSDLVQGELAVNVTDKRIFTENASGTVVELGTNPSTLTVAADATIYGVKVGRGAGSVSTNTAVGASALAANTTGAGGVAIGNKALFSNTTGADNTAVGGENNYVAALGANTTGTRNVGIGSGALRSNSTGSDNTALGTNALQANTTASNNTAVGYQAAYSNTTGTRHSAFGLKALYTNTTGTNNNAFGIDALGLNTTGSYNTAFGDTALGSNTTASNNTAVGYQAGYSNAVGSRLTYIGYQAGLGTSASGNYNVSIGALSGYSLTSGSQNTFVGDYAGNAMTSGSSNTIIGRYNGNQGGLDIRTASNHIVLSDGDGNPRYYYGGGHYFTGINSGAGTYAMKWSSATGQVTYDTSSARYKDNIRDSVYGLEALMQIRSAQFEYKEDGRSDVGLIAEEVHAVIPELVALDEEGNPNAVSYDRFVSVCIKAIQELKAEFDAYKEAHP